jgi:hypothetical protein
MNYKNMISASFHIVLPLPDTNARNTNKHKIPFFLKILILDVQELQHSAKISQILIPLKDISSETVKDRNNE